MIDFGDNLTAASALLDGSNGSHALGSGPNAIPYLDSSGNMLFLGSVAAAHFSGDGGMLTGIPESGVTNLVSDLAARALASRLINTASPLSGGGNLTADRTIAFANQNANLILGGPSTGAAAAPGFRSLVAADIPSLDAGKITTGVLVTARLGTGTANDDAFLRGDGTWANGLAGVQDFAETVWHTSGGSAHRFRFNTAGDTWYDVPAGNHRFRFQGSDVATIGASGFYTTTTDPTLCPLRVQAQVSQSQDLLQFQDGFGSLLARVDQLGAAYFVEVHAANGFSGDYTVSPGDVMHFADGVLIGIN